MTLVPLFHSRYHSAILNILFFLSIIILFYSLGNKGDSPQGIHIHHLLNHTLSTLDHRILSLNSSKVILGFVWGFDMNLSQRTGVGV